MTFKLPAQHDIEQTADTLMQKMSGMPLTNALDLIRDLEVATVTRRDLDSKQDGILMIISWLPPGHALETIRIVHKALLKNHASNGSDIPKGAAA